MSIALVEVQVFSLAPNVTERRVGGAVTQRSAKPFRRVRLSYVPPNVVPEWGYFSLGGRSSFDAISILSAMMVSATFGSMMSFAWIIACCKTKP